MNTKFVFKTKLSPKKGDDIIPVTIPDIIYYRESCGSVRNAVELWYRDDIKDRYGVVISDHALSTKKPVYKDEKYGPMQTGYSMTASWRGNRINLEIEVITIVETDFNN